MALSKKPVNGMKDILPEEMQIRDYVQQVIKETYRNFGFTQIETPCMENIANLSSKQGGENEKLIFKVMKRGEKLKIAEAKDETDLVDFGMRYDLTVPLVRYYSNNANDLPSPFKALQMGNVWRADRPQRGRYRQFMQCDIDIIGEPTNLAEIELILATTTTIGKLGFKNFEIRINERRILKAMAAYSGFAEEDFDTVFIILDKMDKIGLDGVILTKLDGDTRGGAALSIRAVTGQPILYVGMGEKLSDLEQFYPDRMASRILGMGDVLTLIEKAGAELDEEKAMQMADKMKKAQFDFEDYLMSMEQMRKMGGLSSIMSMMPGLGGLGGKNKLPDLDSPENDKKMARMEAIIYSMTPEERKNPDLLNPSRKHRIAKGAGVDISEVNRMVKQFNESRKMMKKLPGMMGGKGGKKGRFRLPF